jgi:hypothetical protein
MLTRRHVLKLAAALAATPAGAHTPYGQWTVYRRRNLFIVAARTDERALALARAFAEGLATELPESHARMTRATDRVRVASLLATEQLDVAIVAREDAAAMREGSGAFRSVGPTPLCTLAEFGAHLLVALESFKPRHAYLLSGAADHLSAVLRGGDVSNRSVPPDIPVHPGAAMYLSGLPLPGGGTSSE